MLDQSVSEKLLVLNRTLVSRWIIPWILLIIPTDNENDENELARISRQEKELARKKKRLLKQCKIYILMQ